MSADLLNRHKNAVLVSLRNPGANLVPFYQDKKISPSQQKKNNFREIRQVSNMNINDFNISRKLGEGAFGEVFLATYKDNGLKVAIKKLKKSKMPKKAFIDEITNMKHVQNQCEEHVLCFLNHFEDSTHYVIVSEALIGFIDYSDFLRKNVGKLMFQNVLTIMRNMVNGLTVLHNLNMIHSDIKPQNLMINEQTYQIKYIDLGTSCFGYNCNPVGSTPLYYPVWYDIEAIWKGKPMSFKEKKKADVFALGLTMTETMADLPLNPNNTWAFFDDAGGLAPNGDLVIFRYFRFNPTKFSGADINFVKTLAVLMCFPIKDKIIPLSVVKKIVDSGNTSTGLKAILDHFNIKTSLGNRVSDIATLDEQPSSPLASHIDILRKSPTKERLILIDYD